MPMKNYGPRIVSDQAMRDLDAERAAKNNAVAPRVIFLEAISPEQFIQVAICGEWDEDMAEALTNFIARRKRQSAPIVETAHNSGEGLPSSDAAEVGADTQQTPGA